MTDASLTDRISDAVTELEDWERELVIDASNFEDMLSEAHYMLASARRLVEIAGRVETKVGPGPLPVPENVRQFDRGDGMFPPIRSRADRLFPARDADRWD